ncbi:MAG: DUF1592 domain-containing protein [Bryobacteraceae bacterium]
MRFAVLIFALSTPFAFAADAWRGQVAPFFQKNCAACHNAKLRSGGVDFTAYADSRAALDARDVFEKALAKVKTGEMPPKGLPRPKPAEVASVDRWFEQEFARIDRNQPPDPGRVTARRLNRDEYNRTVRDLLGVDIRPADAFPPDDSGYGFDNIGDVLSVSPVLMERYLSAADKLVKAAIVAGPPPKPTMEKHPRPPKWTPGVLEIKHRFPYDADYKIRFSVGGERKDKDTDPIARVGIALDGRALEAFDVDIHTDTHRAREVQTHVTAGEHSIRVAFQSEPGPKESITVIEVRGPYDARMTLTESHKRIFVCADRTPDCGRRIVSTLARRAWRRPLTDAETVRLASFITAVQQDGGSFEEGVRLALKAILVSPNFLFRIERDPQPAGPHRVTDLELASRLSYFLWSSTPDEELLGMAERNQLSKDLRAQVARMLRDPKSNALAENFAGQWLELRNLNTIKPDPQRFPSFDEDLRQSMKTETRLFFDFLLRENRSIFEFLSADYSFLNERLAKHYGIDGVTGPEFRRVQLTDTRRGGVFTQASVLTVSSYPTRTSPVIRGKYVLENFLNAAPPPPPADVPPLDEQALGTSTSMRQQLEVHRANAVCASCHSRMDPIGFGLENFDAIGKWRSTDGKFPIDATGELPGGRKFEGAPGLRKVLLDRKDDFRSALVEKLLTYALGRGLERYDRPAIQSISRRMAADGDKFQSLIFEITASVPFVARRAESAKPSR